MRLAAFIYRALCIFSTRKSIDDKKKLHKKFKQFFMFCQQLNHSKNKLFRFNKTQQAFIFITVTKPGVLHFFPQKSEYRKVKLKVVEKFLKKFFLVVSQKIKFIINKKVSKPIKKLFLDRFQSTCYKQLFCLRWLVFTSWQRTPLKYTVFIIK